MYISICFRHPKSSGPLRSATQRPFKFDLIRLVDSSFNPTLDQFSKAVEGEKNMKRTIGANMADISLGSPTFPAFPSYVWKRSAVISQGTAQDQWRSVRQAAGARTDAWEMKLINQWYIVVPDSHNNHNWLVVEPPLWKIWVRQLGLFFPIHGKIKNVPSHQPDKMSLVGSRWCLNVSQMLDEWWKDLKRSW